MTTKHLTGSERIELLCLLHWWEEQRTASAPEVFSAESYQRLRELCDKLSLERGPHGELPSPALIRDWLSIVETHDVLWNCDYYDELDEMQQNASVDRTTGIIKLAVIVVPMLVYLFVLLRACLSQW